MLCSFKSSLKTHLSCDACKLPKRLSSWCAVITAYYGNCLHETVGVKHQTPLCCMSHCPSEAVGEAVAVFGGTHCSFLSSSV